MNEYVYIFMWLLGVNDLHLMLQITTKNVRIYLHWCERESDMASR